MALREETNLTPGEKLAFSKVIGKFLLAAERRAWVVGVESAKEYLELAEGLREGEGRWEEGRGALRWLVRYVRSQAEAAGTTGATGEWRARLERRLREKQYAERTVETYVGRLACDEEAGDGGAESVGWVGLGGEGLRTSNGLVLLFLERPEIEPANNRAERGLRGAVIARKVSHCSKNERGAGIYESGNDLGRELTR